MIDLKNAATKPCQLLKSAVNKKQLAHAYLFSSKLTQQALATAYWLACLVNCTGDNKPDGTCRNCQRILSGNHPDVFLVQPEGRKSLSIEQIRPLKEELAKSPVEGTRRFFIVESAQLLTMPAANALLNLLEEPVAPVTTILLTNNPEQILPTVRSRVQTIEFVQADTDSKTSELLEYGLSEAEIENLGDTSKLDQSIKYFYQELIAGDKLAFVSAHKLTNQLKTSEQEQYVWFCLKKWCQKDLVQNQASGRLLSKLVECDKMQASNVSFLNRLDYLVLG
ncbi:DNA polymerase III subunit delta [Lactobacillus psittaci]|uniref:DNA replication ATPase n=1 Tax=Lactobacillus psittaci DSM 15354 TaxID=1122152 RepID=A0A0R1S238_9LACO|nr:DNA polymerase III subunit delta [Lactobacillus psittaci]KRL63100.1 DNA replication ATPase [Lactobacillus psittaci DSM 15354]